MSKKYPSKKILNYLIRNTVIFAGIRLYFLQKYA
ncbi:MAG: hypothetical protein K0R51_3208 [Cytophagaceae bacterium]|jgi:hypothetical protein|nr:hypothetical protein [Cytophagaceae bacterium]